MEKPQDFDTVQEFVDFEKLEKGGHICRIIKAEEYVSQNGYEMIKIYLDTDKTDKQPEFFSRKYENDSRENKKWGCILYTMLYEVDGSTNRSFKTLVSSIEKSNNFTVSWGENFYECLKGKLVGGIFRNEEYLGNDGKPHMFTKCFAIRSVETIKKGVAIPKDKLLEARDFTVSLNDDDLPF